MEGATYRLSYDYREGQKEGAIPFNHKVGGSFHVGVMVPIATKPWCCQLECDKDAEFGILGEDEDPYSATDVCAEHLPEFARSDNVVHTVWRIA